MRPENGPVQLFPGAATAMLPRVVALSHGVAEADRREPNVARACAMPVNDAGK